MSRIAYVNGRYSRHAEACMHIENRGTQFSDGVYEVIAIVGDRLIDLEWHHERLERSLGALDIAVPMSRAALNVVLREIVRRNRVEDGIVYLQIDRGVAPRGHAFPAGVRPSVIATSRRALLATMSPLFDGVNVITVPDQRWRRRDIKTVSLLANVLAKQRAAEAGAFEAWQVDGEGFVTEGTQSNAWIVTQDGGLVTRPLSDDILSGITRRRLIALARADGISVEERAFTVEEAQAAREAFLTSTSSFVVPIVQIDESVVANGRPGSVTCHVRDLYITFARSS